VSAPAGPRLSWTAFVAVMVPVLVVIGMWLHVMASLLSRGH